MNSDGYISLLNTSGNSGYTSLFAMSISGEKSGNAARNTRYGLSSSGGYGGETAGSVASSFGGSVPSFCGGSSSGGCSFSAVA